MKIQSIFIYLVIILSSCIGEDSDPVLPGGNGGCPTTSACGCSGYNKSDCETHSCCKWTVGQGCGCK